jgi:hypothetical protein
MSTRQSIRRADTYRFGWCAGCDQPAHKPSNSDFCDSCADDAPLLGTVRRTRPYKRGQLLPKRGR